MKDKNKITKELKNILWSFIEDNLYNKNIYIDFNDMILKNNDPALFFSKYISKDKEYINLIKEYFLEETKTKDTFEFLKKESLYLFYLNNAKIKNLSFKEMLNCFLKEPNNDFFQWFSSEKDNLHKVLEDGRFLELLLKNKEYFEKCEKEIPNFKNTIRQFINIFEENHLTKKIYLQLTNLLDLINKENLYLGHNLNFLNYESKLQLNIANSSIPLSIEINQVIFSKDRLKKLIELFKKETQLTGKEIFFHLIKEFEGSSVNIKLDTNFTKNFTECLKEICDEKIHNSIEKQISLIVKKEINKKVEYITSNAYMSKLNQVYNYLEYWDNLELLKEYRKINPNIDKFIIFNEKMEEILDNKKITNKPKSLKMKL